MTDVLSITFGLAGGLALFLYGMALLSKGLQKAAGDKLKYFLEKLTDRPFKGILTGAFVTAVIQSSSITTVTIVGLLNAGLMTLTQAIVVIMGANIGTTMTAQIIVFKIGKYSLPIIALGTLIYLVPKNKQYKYIGRIILGFGILFLGMSFMSQGAKPLSNVPFIINLLATFGENPVLGIIAGAIFTGIIQSSSATTALVIALSMDNTIGLKAAIALIIGANIGTCITAIIASIGSSLSGKRAAAAHVIFNLIGALVFFPLINRFTSLITLTSVNLPRQIANAHTFFNITTTLMMIPSIYLLVFIVKKIIPGKETKIDTGIKFLDKGLLNIPSVALSQATKEINKMGKISLSMIDDAEKAFLQNDRQAINIVMQKEQAIDELWHSLNGFLIELSEKAMTKKDSQRFAVLSHSISDIERVGDHLNNIAELAEKKIKQKVNISSQAEKEIKSLFEDVRNIYSRSLETLRTENKESADGVDKLEDDIDKKEEKFEASHIIRLKKKICNPIAGIMFVDALRNLERIGDHSLNIASAVRVGF